MIRVLIVDDSLTTREYLKYIIDSDPDLFLVGEAANGAEAVDKVARLKPDVVIMDIQMPKMDGYTATQEIMQTFPVPIVIHSTLVAPEQSENIFAAMAAGAVAVAEKPPGIGHPGSEALTSKLLRTVKLMSEVKVVKRKKTAARQDPKPVIPFTVTKPEPASVVCIGASTGGPPTLQNILSQLDKNFNIPILVVQHISKGFLAGMIHWLSKDIRRPMTIPRSGESIMPGHIYFSPEDTDMSITANRKILLSNAETEVPGRRPITHLFRSAAKNLGNHAVGVLLTGMGNDGAVGLKEMRDRGAATIVQDRDSAVIFGMPAEAIRLDAADHVLPPKDIAAYLNAMIMQKAQ